MKDLEKILTSLININKYNIKNYHYESFYRFFYNFTVNKNNVIIITDNLLTKTQYNIISNWKIKIINSVLLYPLNKNPDIRESFLEEILSRNHKYNLMKLQFIKILNKYEISKDVKILIIKKYHLFNII